MPGAEVSDVDLERLSEPCQRFGIATPDVFESVARGVASSSSDLDLLYQLQPGRSLGWEIEDLSYELATPCANPFERSVPRSRSILQPNLPLHALRTTG